VIQSSLGHLIRSHAAAAGVQTPLADRSRSDSIRSNTSVGSAASFAASSTPEPGKARSDGSLDNEWSDAANNVHKRLEPFTHVLVNHLSLELRENQTVQTMKTISPQRGRGARQLAAVNIRRLIFKQVRS
jgi:hypothetical protein